MLGSKIYKFSITLLLLLLTLQVTKSEDEEDNESDTDSECVEEPIDCAKDLLLGQYLCLHLDIDPVTQQLRHGSIFCQKLFSSHVCCHVPKMFSLRNVNFQAN